jgi:hypothetical protein
MNQNIQIQSIGPPPEKYSDWVVAKMIRDVVERHSCVRNEIVSAIKNSSDGSPRAQKKLEQRIYRAGAISTHLYPGKRGKYYINIWDWTGWDPARDEEISPKDAMPTKPWLAFWVSRLESEGRGKNHVSLRGTPLVFVTHHSLSRAAQRWGVRDGLEMMAAVGFMWNESLLYLVNGRDFSSKWCETAPDGDKVKIGDTTMIVKKHEKREALVVATVY